MYKVIGNIYRGEGFTWVIDTMQETCDNWKYSQHGTYETMEEAEKVSNELNVKYGG